MYTVQYYLARHAANNTVSESGEKKSEENFQRAFGGRISW
jgi:hypothetical protein